ncbi:MAG: hypothetical protein P8J86_07340 [Phycisphaerales bacterium]|nr:hypothetical protein [Phycisphaerales bacterium]
MATSILVGAVFAVTTAITAGQQHSIEARKNIAAALAAEALLGRMVATPYNELNQFNGLSEEDGNLIAIDGNVLPASFDGLARYATVSAMSLAVDDLSVVIQGKMLTVWIEDQKQRSLIELTRFVPEPQA